MTKPRISKHGMIGAMCGVAAYVMVGFSNPLAWFGMLCLLALVGGFVSAIIQGVFIGWRRGIEKQTLAKHGIEANVKQGWLNTDYATGEGREALEIEVPLEVRKWAEHANEWADKEFGANGSITILIGAVPNMNVCEDTPAPFHMTYTMSKHMHPMLFCEMVNSFNMQVPTLMASQGMNPDVEDGD